MVKITLVQHGFPGDRTEIAGIPFKRGEMQEVDIKNSWMMIGTPYLRIEVERNEIDTLSDKQLMILGNILSLEDIDEIKDRIAPKPKPTVVSKVKESASKVKKTISKVLPLTSEKDESESSEESEESLESE